ncbi:hypothetical protein V501_06515 [Pseudogymnoascus sp. VKM F-4519 (FW-2642)]|nr:hypothetical protein V501_06515 [Pseudogymnoascus sp. VKM F-4519 (FW-2642)]
MTKEADRGGRHVGPSQSRAWLNQLEAAHRDHGDVGANKGWKATHTIHGVLEKANVINPIKLLEEKASFEDPKMAEVDGILNGLKVTEPSHPTTTLIKVGDKDYHIELSKIPYLSAFADFETKAQTQPKELVHGPIAHFDAALKGIESGFRQCFRSLPPDLGQHHALCETYEFLCIDVLGGQSLNEVIDDLKSGKNDYELEYKYYRTIKGNKSKARDAAYKLLHLILNGKFEDETKDSVKVHNAVMFLVSHANTFKWRTRKVVRAAYEERFVISVKQRAGLDKWEKTDAVKLAKEDEDDVTTEEEESVYYGSDYSD